MLTHLYSTRFATPRRFRLSPIVSIRLVRRFRSDWRFGTQSMSSSRLGVDESEAYFPQARLRSGLYVREKKSY